MTPRPANVRAGSARATGGQDRVRLTRGDGWSAGLRPASRGSAKPAPMTPRPANVRGRHRTRRQAGKTALRATRMERPMLRRMRVTVSLDDADARQDVRREATAQGVRLSVSAVIARIVDDALKRPEPTHVKPFRLITVGGEGLCPRIDLDGASARTRDRATTKRATADGSPRRHVAPRPGPYSNRRRPALADRPVDPWKTASAEDVGGKPRPKA